MNRDAIKRLLLAVLYEGKQSLLNGGMTNHDNPIKVATAAIQVFEGASARGEDVIALMENLLWAQEQQ